MDKELIKLIEENGLTLHGDFDFFAHLVAEREREACAKECEKIERHKWQAVMNGGAMQGIGARDCAAAIRARGGETCVSHSEYGVGYAAGFGSAAPCPYGETKEYREGYMDGQHDSKRARRSGEPI